MHENRTECFCKHILQYIRLASIATNDSWRQCSSATDAAWATHISDVVYRSTRTTQSHHRRDVTRDDTAAPQPQHDAFNYYHSAEAR